MKSKKSKKQEPVWPVFVDGPNLFGLIGAMKALRYELRYNDRAKWPEIRLGYDDRYRWHRVDDDIILRMRARMERCCAYVVGKGTVKPLAFGRQRFSDLLYGCALASNRVDPFKEWLLSIPEYEGDVLENDLAIDNLFTDLFNVKKTPFNIAKARMLFLTVVWRTFSDDPDGYKMDESLVLYSEQGWGKDGVLKSLVPQEFYCDSLVFSNDETKMMIKTRGKAIVHVSEMTGVVKGAEKEHLKSFLSRCVDEPRWLYRNEITRMIRRFGLVFSTNEQRCLPDDSSGHRRWIVMHLPDNPGRPVEPVVEGLRNQLWAEAIALYKKGVRPNMTREFLEMAKKENKKLYGKYYVALGELIRQAMRDGRFSKGQVYPLYYILETIEWYEDTCGGELKRGKRVDRKLEYQLIDELRRLNWHEKRGQFKGRQTRGWACDRIKAPVESHQGGFAMSHEDEDLYN